MKDAKEVLVDIATELTGKEYKDIMFPLDPLWNFQPSPRLSPDSTYTMYDEITPDGYSHSLDIKPIRREYGFSVNALMFFVAALENLLWDEIEIDGKKTKVSIEEGLRAPKEQQRRREEWLKECAEHPELNLRLDQFVDPSVKPSSHCLGAALDKRHAGKIIMKDIIKVNYDPYSKGKEAYRIDQQRIKDDYFIKFKDASWSPDMWSNMHASSHIVLSGTGKLDRNAIIALANNQIQQAVDIALPFLTITNDEGHHTQERPFLSVKIGTEVHNIALDSPIMYPEDFAKQDFDIVERISNRIMDMAESVKDLPIYYTDSLTYGRRIFQWGPSAKGHCTPLGSKDSIHEQIDKAKKRRERSLEQLNYRRR